MTVFQSILLGIIQGIAEFLPISSSGHLKVAQTLLSLPDVPLLFDVFLHLATLLAVFIYFRKKIADLLVVFFRWITLKKCADENEVSSSPLSSPHSSQAFLASSQAKSFRKWASKSSAWASL